MDVLRQAATEHNLPWGLLARAALHRLRGDATAAARLAQDQPVALDRDTLIHHRERIRATKPGSPGAAK